MTKRRSKNSSILIKNGLVLTEISKIVNHCPSKTAATDWSNNFEDFELEIVDKKLDDSSSKLIRS